MARRIRQVLSSEIEALAKRLEAYRKRPRRQRRLPEGYWTQAAALARQHGVCCVQRALRLNYHDLKQRAEALGAPDPKPLRTAVKGARPAFVELSVPPPALGCGAAILELEDRLGRKLTVRLARENGAALAALARAVWSCRP